MSSIWNRTLLKVLFKVQLSPLLIPFLDGDNKTIFKDLEQQFESSKLTPKLPHILNFANILEVDMKMQITIAAPTENYYCHIKF